MLATSHQSDADRHEYIAGQAVGGTVGILNITASESRRACEP